MTPKISVVIPTYNYARYLPEAIESVLGQNYADFELLIIDDHSADDTADAVSRYQKDKRVSFRVNSHNIGMVENWNLCLREARGEYVKYLFADDLLSSPDALGQMAAALEADPGVSMVASARLVIDSDSRRIATWATFPDSGSLDGASIINRCLVRQKNLIGEPTAVMFRKRLAGRGFHTGYRQIVDMEFWFHLLEQGGLAYMRAPLVAFRVHEKQQTRHSKGDSRLIDDTDRLLSDYAFNEDKRYIALTRIQKAYLACDRDFQIWKLYRRGIMEKSAARERIISARRWTGFTLGYPLYKIAKPIFKSWAAWKHKAKPTANPR